MKTKEKLALIQYPEVLEDDEWDKNLQYREPFIEGWNSAEQKLEQIAKQLQKEDITSVVYALREVIKRMKQ